MSRFEDKYQDYAVEDLKKFFDSPQNKNRVFYSRQLEVIFEKPYYHWITNRAVRSLIETGFLNSEEHKISTSGSINLVWHKSNRNYKRSAKEVLSLVEQYSDPNISYEIGSHLERMILEAFSIKKFLCEGRDVNEFNGIKWLDSNHNLDFIFTKDYISYGVEVKNTLGYMDKEEFDLKRDICFTLNIKPIFVCRMLPKSWIEELRDLGGFCLILKYQIYPAYFKSIVNSIKGILELPVDYPRKIEDGTMQRVLNWHNKNAENNLNQH